MDRAGSTAGDTGLLAHSRKGVGLPVSDRNRRDHRSSGSLHRSTNEDLEIWNDCVARQLVAIGCDENDVLQTAYGYGLFTGGFGVHGGAS